MAQSRATRTLSLSDAAQAKLIAAARDREPVRGLTHGFYKYPARFSPTFARAAIEIFTKPGELILDPHVGGGTTLVEALATGRQGVGIDVSQLAEFVANVKCTVLSEVELQTVHAWAAALPFVVDIRQPSLRLLHYADLGYYKHLSHPRRWRLRKAIEQALGHAKTIGSPRLEPFGRCVVLRTAQWALDGRRKHTTIEEFRNGLRAYSEEMLQGARELREAASKHGHYPITVLNRNAAGIEDDARLSNLACPRLVLTSPPYPGIHVLYHRWQVDGRKEAPLPFLIANRLDGAGGSFYTMGDRKFPGLETYFNNIRDTMSSVAKISNRRTIIVQMLAFSKPAWQLPRYLETMEQAGLEEVCLSLLQDERDGRLWRSVPNRRWYSGQRGETPGSLEVVLFHRKAVGASKRPSAAFAAASNTTTR